MKKSVVMLSVLCLIFSMSACGKNNESVSNNKVNKGTISSQLETKDTNRHEDDSEDKIKLEYTWEDPGKAVVFDYPNLKCIEEGTSQIFKNSNYVIAYCREDGEADLKDIPDMLSENFKNATDCYINGDFSSFNITETEEININDTDALMIKGTIICTYYDNSSTEIPIKGYTFLKDGMMCELIAILDSEDENQAEMEATVDAMIQTLRNEK